MLISILLASFSIAVLSSKQKRLRTYPNNFDYQKIRILNFRTTKFWTIDFEKNCKCLGRYRTNILDTISQICCVFHFCIWQITPHCGKKFEQNVVCLCRVDS